MKKRHLLFIFLITSSIANAQTDEVKIQTKLQKYPAFSDCSINVEKDSLATHFYKIDITFKGKTLHAETLKKNNDYLVLLDAQDSFISDLIKQNPGKLANATLKKGFYIVADKKYTLSKNELPKKYQINIPKSDDQKSNPINYKINIEKGFNLVGELQSDYVTSIINTSPNTKKLKKVVLNTSLKGDVLPIIFYGKTPNTQFLQQLKVNMNVYNYLNDTDLYTTEPLNAIFTLDAQSGFGAALQTIVHVKYLDFLGINKENFLVKGSVRMHPELHVPEIHLIGSMPFKKRNLIPHLPKIKMKNLGLKLAMNPKKNSTTNKITYNFDFGFLGNVKWGKDTYKVTFPKDKKTKKYRVEFASLALSKLFPDSKYPLLKDAFKDISLSNVYLRDVYFEAKFPFAGINIDLVGFKKNSSEKEYNLAFNFPSLNIADLISHEAGFSFPKIDIPHNVVAFYIPEVNLPSKSASNKERIYKIPSLNSIPSLKLKSFFTDDKGKNTFPKKGFSLNYGLSFEHFDLGLGNFFTDDFKDLGISLDGIKLTELNITTKTISCQFPIGKTNIKLTAFKVPELPKMNLIFEVPNFEFKNYISGISGTSLADIGRFKNFKMIAIPSGNKTHMKHDKISLKWSSLPDQIRFSFPEFSGGSNSTLDFSLGFNVYAPSPNFSGDVKTLLDNLQIKKLPVFKAKISPNFLFKNWLSWNGKSSSSNSSGTAANNNPQVQDSPEFREDFFLSDIPLPEFSVSNINFKEPTFSFDGLKFDFPLTVNNKGQIEKSGKKLMSIGQWAAMINANVHLSLANDKTLKFDNTKIILDKQNKAISFTTKISEEQKIYETPKDSLGNVAGKKELKKVVPTSVFSTDQIDVKKIDFDAKYNYNAKNFYGFITGEMELYLKNDSKSVDVEATLHYNKKEHHFTPLFKLFSVDGISFTDFKTVELPSPLPQINHLSVYDIEFAENYFFLGLSKESIANKKIDSVDYIIAFKAKGQAKYNFGAKSKHLITTLLKDAPANVDVDNFYGEKFTYIPVGNGIKDIEFKHFPPKIGQHFNPTQQEKVTLFEGADIQALYNGTFNFGGVELDVKKVPVGFRFKEGGNPNDNQKVRDGFQIAMKLPHFSIEGIHFEPDTLAIVKEAGVWNTTLKTQIHFDYEGKNIKLNALAHPYDKDSIKGVKFSATNNIAFQLPDALDYIKYDNVTLSADIERVHKVTTISLSGDLKLGGKTYATRAELLKKDNKFNDIVFKLTGDAIALKDIPQMNTLPEVDKITIKNPEISLHHIAGEISYNQFTTKGVIFKDPNAVALILGFDDFKLSDISSSIPKGIQFKKSTLVLSSGAFKKNVSDLPVAVRTYFKNYYSDKDAIDITSGISIFTNFNPAKLTGDTGKFFKEIGMNQDFVVAGGLGANLSGITAFDLFVSTKKEIKTKGRFRFINNVKKPKFFISYKKGSIGMGLQAETRIKIDKDVLGFKLKLGLNYSVTGAPGIAMDATMNGKWNDPMGLNGLAIENVGLKIDGKLTGDLDISFKGNLDVDKDSIFVSATIPATGNLAKFAFCGTATTLSNETFLTIGAKLINGATNNGKLSFQQISDEIPVSILGYKDVALAFVPPLLPEQNGVKCSALISGIKGGGMAFKGKGILGNEKLGGTWQIAEVDATVGLLDGISIQADISDIDLNFITLKGVKLDVVAKLSDGKANTHFRLNGKAGFLGVDEQIALNFSPQRVSFEVDFKIPDLLTTKAKVYTTNGMNFKPDNTLMVYADIKDFLHNDYLNQLGKVLSDELKKLDKGYDALKKDVDKAQVVVDTKFADLQQVRNKIIAERQEVLDQLKKAKKKADDLQSSINSYNKDANSQKNKSCRDHYTIHYWVPFHHKSKKIYFTDWGCKATAWTQYLVFKGLADGLEGAKYLADKLVTSIESSINFVPIEADPRMAAPLLALETAKGVLAFAKALLNASEKINNKFADLVKDLKTPEVLKDLFYLKKASVSGSFNAFQIAKDTISVTIKAKVFEQDIDNGIAITLDGMKDLKKSIFNSLHTLAKHKTTTIKKANSAHKLYATPAVETLTFDWEKATGRVSDITTINNKVYGIGTNNLVYEYDPTANKTKWKQIGETNFRVWRIAGGSNSLYAVGIGYGNPRKDFLWRWNGDKNWEKIPGIENTMDAAIGNDGTIYVLKEDYTMYYSSSNEYTQIPVYKTVLGKKTQVGVKKLLASTVGLQWHQITSARAKRIDVDSKNNIYHIGLSNRVWKSNDKGAHWNLVGGDSNKKYAKNLFVVDDEIFIQQNPDKTTWFFESKFFNNWVRTNGKSNAITKVGNVLYSSAVDGDYVWKATMPINFTGWKKTTIKMKDIGSNSSGDVWGVTLDNNVLKYNNGKWKHIIHRDVKRISVAESGIPYVIDGEAGQHNKVIYFKNGGWHEASLGTYAYDVGGQGHHISGAATSQKPSNVWMYNKSQNSYARAGTGKGFRITEDATGNLWIIGGAHALWKWDGATWRKYGGWSRDLAIAPNGSIWTIGKNYDLFYKVKENTPYIKANRKGTAVAFSSDTIFVIGTDGFLWYLKI